MGIFSLNMLENNNVFNVNVQKYNDVEEMQLICFFFFSMPRFLV